MAASVHGMCLFASIERYVVIFSVIWRKTWIWCMTWTLHFFEKFIEKVSRFSADLGVDKKYHEKWHSSQVEDLKTFWYLDKYSMKRLQWGIVCCSSNSMQYVHSIFLLYLKKTPSVVLLQVFCRLFTNLLMITRISCQLMRAYNHDKVLEKIMSDIMFAT